MSQLPPLPSPATPPLGRGTDFIRPLALASLVVGAVLMAAFLLQAALALPLANSTTWRQLVTLAWEYDLPPSVLWLMAHPVATSLWLAASCIPTLLASWGLYLRKAWGLWSYVALLLLTAVGNVLLLWWLDSVLVDVIARVTDPALLHELQVQRGVFSLTVLGTCVLFAALQGWLSWRLLQPDVRRHF